MRTSTLPALAATLFTVILAVLYEVAPRFLPDAHGAVFGGVRAFDLREQLLGAALSLSAAIMFALWALLILKRRRKRR